MIGIALCLIGSGAIQADDSKKNNITLPKSLAESVKTIFPESKVIGVEKEEKNGEVLYEVKLRYKAGLLEATLTFLGKVIKVEMTESEDDDKKAKGKKGEDDDKKGNDDDKKAKGKNGKNPTIRK